MCNKEYKNRISSIPKDFYVHQNTSCYRSPRALVDIMHHSGFCRAKQGTRTMRAIAVFGLRGAW